MSHEFEKALNEYELQQEYSTTNIQEAMFQLTNTNDKIKLDLKKISLIINELQKKTQAVVSGQTSERVAQSPADKLLTQLGLGFAQIHSKTVRNDQQYKHLESLTKESLQKAQKLKTVLREAAGGTSPLIP